MCHSRTPLVDLESHIHGSSFFRRVAAAGKLVDEAIRTGPIAGSEHLLVGLANRAHRDRVDDVDRLRRVMRALALLTSSMSSLSVDGLARPRDHDRLHRLAPLLVGNADHGDRQRSMGG